MQKFLEMPTQKIKSLDEIDQILKTARQDGLRIVQCHGVFDLLHPGHIRHFKRAKEKGDILVVTVTPDRFVNKGPGRPVFTETLRLESLAALQDIDYVVLNNSPDATSAIEQVRPLFYAKGIEYRSFKDDITGKIAEEAGAVENLGGEIFYTDDIVFSSSSILNQFFDQIPPEVAKYIKEIKKQYTADDLIQKIEDLSNLNVLVIGDAIIDEYQFAEPLGQTGKGQHLVVKCLEKEIFLGGSLIVANHVAQFTPHVTLLTAIGEKCPYLKFVEQNLDKNIQKEFTYLEGVSSLVKKRYVSKDGQTLTKLFETYAGQEKAMNRVQNQQIIDYLQKRASNFDLVLVCDFGNGFTNSAMVDAISDLSAYVALNTQTNSGNRGYNMVTNYRKANYISLNEPELRLSMHDKTSDLEGLASDICQIMSCKNISITRGIRGVLFCSNDRALEIPAFATSSVDRIGAGDSYLSLSSLCMAMGYPPILSGFIGSIAAAMSVQMIGNQDAIKKIPLCKFITRLMK